MSRPSSANLVTRKVLTQASIMYRNQEGAYVGDRLFPLIDNVDRKSKIPKFHKGPFFRNSAGVRGEGGRAPLVEFDFTTANLDAVNFSAAAKVTQEQREEANKPGNVPYQPDVDTLEFIADRIDLAKEINAASALWAALWSGGAAGGEDANGAWAATSAATNTFLTDIEARKLSMKLNTGFTPNKLFLDEPTAHALKFNAYLLTLFSPTQLTKNAAIQLPALAELIGVEEIIVGGAIENKAAENINGSDWTPYWIWGKQADTTVNKKGMGFLYYAPSTPSKKRPSAGYQYRVKQGNGDPRQSTTWYEGAEHSTYYDTEEDTDITPMCLDCGFMWHDTILD